MPATKTQHDLGEIKSLLKSSGLSQKKQMRKMGGVGKAKLAEDCHTSCISCQKGCSTCSPGGSTGGA